MSTHSTPQASSQPDTSSLDARPLFTESLPGCHPGRYDMTEAVRIMSASRPDGVTAGQGSRALSQGL